MLIKNNVRLKFVYSTHKAGLFTNLNIYFSFKESLHDLFLLLTDNYQTAIIFRPSSCLLGYLFTFLIDIR